MKLMPFLIVLIAALMFLLPTMNQEQSSLVKEAQEESPLYDITVKAKNKDEEKILDILWMKKAAQIAIQQGEPHFNVIHQQSTKNLMEGTIELVSGTMQAEYDAHEIEKLKITDEVTGDL